MPLSRPSVITQLAPAARSSSTSQVQSCGLRSSWGSLLPTSDRTRNLAEARAISSCLSSSGIGATPREISTQLKPASAAQSRHSSALPWAQAISISVPPMQARMSASASRASLAARLVST